MRLSTYRTTLVESQIATKGLGFYFTILQIPRIMTDGFRYNFLSARLVHVLNCLRSSGERVSSYFTKPLQFQSAKPHLAPTYNKKLWLRSSSPLHPQRKNIQLRSGSPGTGAEIWLQNLPAPAALLITDFRINCAGPECQFTRHQYFNYNDAECKILSTNNCFRNENIIKEFGESELLYFKQPYPDETNGFYHPPAAGKCATTFFFLTFFFLVFYRPYVHLWDGCWNEKVSYSHTRDLWQMSFFLALIEAANSPAPSAFLTKAEARILPFCNFLFRIRCRTNRNVLFYLVKRQGVKF